MKIRFKQTEDQIELAKQIGSKNRQVSLAAQESFAELMAPVLHQAYLQADTTRFLFRDWFYTQGEDPSLPLEPYTNVTKGHFTTWSAPMPGGLPSNEIYQPIDELKFKTYQLDSAYMFLKKWAAKGRIDVLAKGIERLVQEVLVKTNRQAWTTLLWALANFRDHTNSLQVRATATANIFTLDDYNNSLTYFRRLNSSWNGGTPQDGRGKPTDLICSPEQMAAFRKMAYNPINTTAALGTPITANQDEAAAVIALPEEQRAEIYRSGGVPTFFGINLIELLELGKTFEYQTIFEDFIGNTTLPALPGASATTTFDPDTDELLLLVDANRDFAYRAIATDADTGSVFTMTVDDQFVTRQGKAGGFGGIEEGRAILENRGCIAVVV